MGSKEFRITKLFWIGSQRVGILLSLSELIIYIIYLINYYFTYLLILTSRKITKTKKGGIPA
jgi:hypothetical protein